MRLVVRWLARDVGRIWGALLLLLLAALACGWDEPPAPPTITAQGFDLAQTRECTVGQAVSLRLRVEAPAGLEAFRVRERSYEADLARSPEPSHLPLFGLPRRVWSKTDVTLDFGPYVFQKLTAPGDYAFEMEVTDRKERSTTATLRVRVLAAQTEAEVDPDTEPTQREPGAEPSPTSPPDGSTSAGRVSPSALRGESLRSGDFRLERVGPGSVASGEEFGITWKTIESNRVVIRIVGIDESGSRFARLEPGAFGEIETRGDLADALEGLGLEETVELAAANDAAAGTEIAIVRARQPTLLRTERSETSLSELGTTVTLTGRYKR